MLASGFAGKTIGVPARAYVYTMIKPNPPSALPPALPYATIGNSFFGNPYLGTYLHFLYSGDANMNFRTSVDPAQPDYVPQQILVEFEAPGVFTVPFDGALTFVGGNPSCNYLAWVYYEGKSCSDEAFTKMDTSNYSPMFHFLKHFTDPAGFAPFVVPDNHTVLLGYNPTDTFAVNGITVTPGVNLPGTIVSPGDTVVPSGQSVAITGWWG